MSIKKLVIHIFILVFLQVLIFNSLNIFGAINPQIYIIFFLLLPIESEKIIYIPMAFLIGLFIDIFSDSGGVHALSCVVLMYIRPLLLKVFFDESSISKEFSKSFSFKKISFIASVVLIQNFVGYLIVFFDFSKFKSIIFLTLTNSVFSLFIIILLLPFYKISTVE